MQENTAHEIGTVATGVTAATGAMAFVNDNLSLLTLAVMVLSAAIATVFQVLNFRMKKHEVYKAELRGWSKRYVVMVDFEKHVEENLEGSELMNVKALINSFLHDNG